MNIFNQLFGVFLKSRRTSHLFRRRAIFESLPPEGRAEAVPDQLSRKLLQQAEHDLASVLEQLDAHKDGLSHAEAQTLEDVGRRQGQGHRLQPAR